MSGCVYLCIGTHFKLCVDALWQLLSIGLEEFSSGLKWLEVLFVADLSVSDGHEVTHYVHKACIVTI